LSAIPVLLAARSHAYTRFPHAERNLNCGEILAKSGKLACSATKLPLFGKGTVASPSIQSCSKEQRTMRKILLAAAAGAAALTLSACSEKTEDAAAETADSAAADASANAEAAGETVDSAASDTATAAANASDAATDAAAAAEADVQGESTTEAKAD
jgi:hypothetical protein